MLELGILDEDILFKVEKLTKKEKKEFELKKKNLRLTKRKIESFWKD